MEFNENPQFYLKNSYEKTIAAQVLEVCRNLGQENIPREDPALDAATRNIALYIKQNGLELISGMDNEALKNSMTEMGVTDNAFRSLLLNVVRARDAGPRIAENLGKEIKNGRFTHFGVGAVRLWWPPTIIVSVVLTRKSVVLNSFPRNVLPGQEVTLSGRAVLPGDSITVIAQGPKKTVNYKPPILSGGYFSQVLLFEEGGNYTIEVMLDSDRGPEVAALFPVAVEGAKAASAEVPIERVRIDTIPEARERLLELINRERAQRDLLPVTLDEKINKLAQDYAEEMKETGEVAHFSPKSGDCADRAKAKGLDVTRITENIAVNQSVEQVHASLMGSPSHRENILDPMVDWVGLGVAFTKDKAQVFVVENFVKYWHKTR